MYTLPLFSGWSPIWIAGAAAEEERGHLRKLLKRANGYAQRRNDAWGQFPAEPWA
jgi:hypothetical protein